MLLIIKKHLDSLKGMGDYPFDKPSMVGGF